jgi:hypothetical protein
MAEQADNLAETLRGLELQLDSHKARMDRLVDAYVDQAIDKPTYEDRKARLLSEQAALEEQLNSLRPGTGRSANLIEKILELATSLHSAYISASPTEKRDLLTEVTSNRVLQGKTLAFTLKSPFAEMAERSKNSYGAPYRDGLRTLARIIFDHNKALDFVEWQ